MPGHRVGDVVAVSRCIRGFRYARFAGYSTTGGVVSIRALRALLNHRGASADLTRYPHSFPKTGQHRPFQQTNVDIGLAGGGKDGFDSALRAGSTIDGYPGHRVGDVVAVSRCGWPRWFRYARFAGYSTIGAPGFRYAPCGRYSTTGAGATQPSGGGRWRWGSVILGVHLRVGGGHGGADDACLIAQHRRDDGGLQVKQRAELLPVL